jgi:hypothetical protein
MDPNLELKNTSDVINETLDQWNKIPQPKRKKIGKMMKGILETSDILLELSNMEPTEENIEKFKKKYPHVNV